MTIFFFKSIPTCLSMRFIYSDCKWYLQRKLYPFITKWQMCGYQRNVRYTDNWDISTVCPTAGPVKTIATIILFLNLVQLHTFGGLRLRNEIMGVSNFNFNNCGGTHMDSMNLKILECTASSWFMMVSMTR